MTSWRCTVHNLEYGHGELPSDLPYLRLCPMCIHTEMVALRTERDEAIEHRDLLLKAIDLKKTIEKARTR